MDHLPECQAVCVAPDETPDECTICAAVRACEQRVHDHYSNLAPAGFLLGVQAARDAVAAAHAADSWTFTDDSLALALAAIDALKGEKP